MFLIFIKRFHYSHNLVGFPLNSQCDTLIVSTCKQCTNLWHFQRWHDYRLSKISDSDISEMEPKVCPYFPCIIQVGSAP